MDNHIHVHSIKGLIRAFELWLLYFFYAEILIETFNIISRSNPKPYLQTSKEHEIICTVGQVRNPDANTRKRS